MELPSPYFSKNGWIAQVDHDTCVINPLIHDKGKFLVVGWDPLGNRCVAPEIFDDPEAAQNWILSLDPQTQIINNEYGSAKVFANLDGEHWWSTPAFPDTKPTYKRLYITYGITHAVRMVENSLYYSSRQKFEDDDIPF